MQNDISDKLLFADELDEIEKKEELNYYRLKSVGFG